MWALAARKADAATALNYGRGAEATQRQQNGGENATGWRLRAAKRNGDEKETGMKSQWGDENEVGARADCGARGGTASSESGLEPERRESRLRRAAS